MADWTQAERDYLRVEVARSGLATPFRGGTVQDLAKQVGGPGWLPGRLAGGVGRGCAFWAGRVHDLGKQLQGLRELMSTWCERVGRGSVEIGSAAWKNRG